MEFACGLMTVAEARLFSAMERRDQRHALAVMRRLRAEVEERDALVAALLHDCGKGGVPVWLRILHVAAPGFGAAVGRQDSRGWRGSAFRLHHHVTLSAELAQAAGCSEVTVRLIAGRHLPEETRLAERLWAADDQS